MRIAIDAKQYFNGPISTRTILQNLLPKLFELYNENEWLVFFDKKDQHLGSPFQQQNIRIVYVPTLTNMFSNLFILPQQIAKLKPDVTLFMMFTPFFRKSRTAVFIHDVLFREYPQYFTRTEKLYFWPISRLTPKADRIICTSEYVSGKLLEYQFASTKSKIDIIPLGISEIFKPLSDHDPSAITSIRKKLDLPDRYILFVGRLNARKNIEALLKAMVVLADKEIRLVVVGSQEWKAPDLQTLTSGELAEKVQFTGSVNDHELSVIYAMATIFCFPSFAEGFGIPPLEAMASGVPVIVSNTTSIPEVCSDAALYINPHKPEEIANSIMLLLNDKSLYQEKRAAGLKRAKLFTWENTAYGILQSMTRIVTQASL